MQFSRSVVLSLFLFLIPVTGLQASAEIQPLQKAELEAISSPESELLKLYLAGFQYAPKAMTMPSQEEVDAEIKRIALLSPTTASEIIPLESIPDLPKVKTEQKKSAFTLKFQNPLKRMVISSAFGHRWGRLHEGIDLAASNGTPILAAESGKVIYSGWASGYGNLISIQHPLGYITRYGHAAKLLVKAGQQVQKGQKIALVGSTGNSTGPHLHFEILISGLPRNPIALLK